MIGSDDDAIKPPRGGESERAANALLGGPLAMDADDECAVGMAGTGKCADASLRRRMRSSSTRTDSGIDSSSSSSSPCS